MKKEVKCTICNDTGIDYRNPEWIVPCDCKKGQIVREYHQGQCIN